MSDEHLIEKSTAILEEKTEARIKAISEAVPRGRIGAAECQCGEPIPDARRWGGYNRCVECVSEDEARARRFGRL